MAELLAFTVWQPWASLIAVRAKHLEFRSYQIKRYVGRRLAVHAGARRMVKAEVEDLVDRCRRDDPTTGLDAARALELLEPVLDALGHSGPSPLPLSAVVCTAVVGENVRGAELMDKLGIQNDSDRAEHSNWGWPMCDVEAIPGPHPHVKGMQGFFYWQDHRGLRLG